MDNRLKLALSKILQTCRSKHTFDVSDQPFFFPENHHHRHLIDLFSPKPHLHHQSPHTFPPNTHRRRPEKTTKKKPHHRKPRETEDFTDNYYNDWRSSDEEDKSDDETTLFSFRSLSSDSSESFRKSLKKPKRHGCRSHKNTPLENSGKLVKDSFAVVKKSRNPHEDFRVSMVEMIVEKQIFGAEELQDLLQCFISLNSEEHHRVILEVFTEIWEALFPASV